MAGCSDPVSVVPTDFSIHLTAPGYTVQQLMEGELELNQIDLEASPIITLDDFRSYDWELHEIEFTNAAREVLGELTSGQLFVVSVFDERIYAGAVWESFSSLAFSGIAIPLEVVRTADAPIRLMNFGDPEATDMRGDPRIREVLEAAGKLQ